MDTVSRRSFRLVCKPGEVKLTEALLEAQGFCFEPEPFWPLARRLTGGPFALGSSLAAFFGLIYIQDRSSMLPPLALAPQSGTRVLDMCASPGSKTGLLAQLVGGQGLVLGNEPGRPRLATLRRNLFTLNLLQTATCSWPGESLPLPDAGWDRIQLDPPCSGWGTSEKHPRVLKLWKGDKVKPLIGLQRRLLTEAARLLRPGGRMVYSTCTTNVEENERQVRFAVEELGLALRPLTPFAGFVFEAPAPGGEGSLRVDESASNAQGFFLACLEKPAPAESLAAAFQPAAGGAPTAPFIPLSGESLRPYGFDPDLLPPGELGVFNDSVHFLSRQALDALPAGLRWQGPAVGRLAGGVFLPSFRLRSLLHSGLVSESPAVPRLQLDETRAIEGLLQGRSLQTGLSGKQAALFWRELPLGLVQLRNGRALWTEKQG